MSILVSEPLVSVQLPAGCWSKMRPWSGTRGHLPPALGFVHPALQGSHPLGGSSGCWRHKPGLDCPKFGLSTVGFFYSHRAGLPTPASSLRVPRGVPSPNLSVLTVRPHLARPTQFSGTFRRQGWEQSTVYDSCVNTGGMAWVHPAPCKPRLPA